MQKKRTVLPLYIERNGIVEITTQTERFRYCIRFIRLKFGTVVTIRTLYSLILLTEYAVNEMRKYPSQMFMSEYVETGLLLEALQDPVVVS